MAYALSQFVPSNNVYTGNIEIDAIVQAGSDVGSDGFVCFFLPTASAGATADGYLFKFDNASGGAHYPGRIFKIVAGVATEIGVPNISGSPLKRPYTAINAARLTGAHHVICHYRKVNTPANVGVTARLSMMVDGVIVQACTDNTAVVNGPVGYGYEGTAGFISRIAVKGLHGIHVLDQDDNAQALVDLGKSGHLGRTLDNILDGTSRKLNAAHQILLEFPTAVINSSGKYIDEAATIVNTGASTASPFTDAQFIESSYIMQGHTTLHLLYQAAATNAKFWFMISSGNGANGINGYALLLNTGSGAVKGQIYKITDGVIAALGSAVATWGVQNNTQLHATFVLHVTGPAGAGTGVKLSFYIQGVHMKTVSDATWQPNGVIGFGCQTAAGMLYKLQVEGKQAVSADLMDPNQAPLIDFTQTGHTSKDLDNIGDGTDYLRMPQYSGLTDFHIDNPMFQLGSGAALPHGWTNGVSGGPIAGTYAYDTTAQFAGKQSLKVTTSAVFAGVMSKRRFACKVGDTLKLIVATKSDTGVANAQGGITFFDKTDASLGSINTPGNLTTAWLIQSISGPVPANTSYARVYFQNTDVGGTSRAYYAGAIQVQKVRMLDDEVSEDTSSGTFNKTKRTALSGGIPKKEILHLFPVTGNGPFLDVDGVRIDVTNVVG